MQGVPVRGTISDIPELVRKYHILEIVIAITTVKGDRLSEIINDADRVAEALIFRLAEVDGPRTGVAGADNEQWRVILRLVGLGVAHRQDQPPQEPHARYGRRVEYRAEDQHRAGDRAVVVDQIEQHDRVLVRRTV